MKQEPVPVFLGPGVPCPGVPSAASVPGRGCVWMPGAERGLAYRGGD